MSDFQAFVFVFLGVVAAMLIPVLKGLWRKEFPPTASVTFPPWVKRYAIFFGLGLAMAMVALAAFKQLNPGVVLTWFQSVLIGFSAESIIEKLGKPA